MVSGGGKQANQRRADTCHGGHFGILGRGCSNVLSDQGVPWKLSRQWLNPAGSKMADGSRSQNYYAKHSKQ